MSISSSVSPAVDKDTALARARAAMENRTKYIESLYDAAEAAAEAHAKVADTVSAAEKADAEHAGAYKDALAAGWTVRELTGSGLPAPTQGGKKGKPSKRTPGRSTAGTRRVGAEHSPPAERVDGSSRAADASAT